MKPRFSNKKIAALTLVEVLVVIVVLAVLVAMILPALKAAKRGGGPSCANNIKQIGLAYRIWAGDNNDKYPMEVSVSKGGTMESSASENVVAIFQVMSNELGTPKILVCRSDTERTFATNFTTRFSANNISYFVGLNANMNSPQTLLSGDDNFQVRGATVKSGLLTLWTNTPVAWSSTRHKFAGNIGFADGSVQWFNNQGLRELLQHEIATNRLAIP